jgi:Arc/MetJ-type ribon-helix-helix transcriptional regulator
MLWQLTIRLNDKELAELDTEVAQGRATNRRDAVRRAIADLDRRRTYEGDADIFTQLRDRGEAVDPDLESIPR